MLEYMDDVLGRLFEYLDSSPLKESTYVMILGDNGSELFNGEMANRDVRCRPRCGRQQRCCVADGRVAWRISPGCQMPRPLQGLG